ncbi:hypothetical protein EXIGLDRAFT_833254 [Exidia glandulosa HHB12029]|uniref:Extracellular membrane protein CFEM domain-containing protein n=1 Tax=Exidia glandulosa HHB12029 TaxID=1314781 RepID=A0A165KWE2_EXIGL|nr:hypothetical protein EXIGLDRAFT_833254 [Exidia glandulosa HHB12029]
MRSLRFTYLALVASLSILPIVYVNAATSTLSPEARSCLQTCQGIVNVVQNPQCSPNGIPCKCTPPDSLVDGYSVCLAQKCSDAQAATDALNPIVSVCPCGGGCAVSGGPGLIIAGPGGSATINLDTGETNISLIGGDGSDNSGTNGATSTTAGGSSSSKGGSSDPSNSSAAQPPQNSNSSSPPAEGTTTDGKDSKNSATSIAVGALYWTSTGLVLFMGLF